MDATRYSDKGLGSELAGMKLHIPEQKTPAKDAAPSHPRKLKKWLADLPHANMGELTRQINTRQASHGEYGATARAVTQHIQQPGKAFH